MPFTSIYPHRALHPTGAVRLAAAVLAAGESRRMGENKLLLPLGNASIVRRVVARVCATGLSDVVVVLGPDAHDHEADLAGLRCRFAHNARYRAGMGTSFATAVDAFEADTEAALFVLADQPFVTTAMHGALLDAFRRHRPPLVLARFDGIIAPPHVIRGDLFPELRHAAPHGAKPVLRPYFDRAVVVELPAEGLIDVDDAESYRRAAQLVAREDGAAEEPCALPG